MLIVRRWQLECIMPIDGFEAACRDDRELIHVLERDESIHIAQIQNG
jgi:hypothetical protein